MPGMSRLPLHAVTLRQPWAGLAAAGLVTSVEVDGCETLPLPVGAWLAIHAGQAEDSRRAGRLAALGLSEASTPLCAVKGALLAVARLRGVRLELASVLAVGELPCRGSAGVWPVPAEVRARVALAWKQAPRPIPMPELEEEVLSAATRRESLAHEAAAHEEEAEAARRVDFYEAELPDWLWWRDSSPPAAQRPPTPAPPAQRLRPAFELELEAAARAVAARPPYFIPAGLEVLGQDSAGLEIVRCPRCGERAFRRPGAPRHPCFEVRAG